MISDEPRTHTVSVSDTGHSTARGAVLGAILGAAGLEVPFVDDLCAPEQKAKEAADLTATITA